MNAERERLEGGDSRKRDGGGKKERHDVVTTSFVRNHVVISDQQSSRNCIAHVFPIHEHSRHIKYLPYNKRKAKHGKATGSYPVLSGHRQKLLAYWGTRLLPHLHSKNVFPDENPTKKAKEMGAASISAESDVEAAEDQAPAKAKSKTHSTKSARKYAAPTIIDSDNDAAPEPPVKPVRRIDFTKFQGSKTVSASNGEDQSQDNDQSPAAKIVADSASDAEDETASSEDSDEDVDSVEMSDNDDGLVDADDFIAEVPQMISARSKLQPKTSAASLDKTSVITHHQSKKDDAEALFDSDKESSAHHKKEVGWQAKVKPRDADSGSDDSMADAPARRPINSDIEMHDVSIPPSIAVDVPRQCLITPGSLAAVALRWDPRIHRKAIILSHQARWRVMLGLGGHRGHCGGTDAEEARQKQADAEKPDIKPAVITAAARNKAPVTTSTREESSWDISAQLVLPAPNKDIGLTVQHESFKKFSATRWTPYMIEAAKAGPAAVHILERLQTDPGFGAILAPIPLDRMNITRGKLKRSAVNCVPAFFELAALTPAEVKVRVEELLKDHRYIFASTAGKLKLDAPFRHGSIRFIIKEEIFSNASFVTQNINRFPARLPKKPKSANSHVRWWPLRQQLCTQLLLSTVRLGAANPSLSLRMHTRRLIATTCRPLREPVTIPQKLAPDPARTIHRSRCCRAASHLIILYGHLPSRIQYTLLI
ncbi:hypothetical protein B0H12DRAFT_1071062 [Mycena haematopus]|nr:hypothetical protein B0H12DRAFT_1071062 [Mycena haematopus]